MSAQASGDLEVSAASADSIAAFRNAFRPLVSSVGVITTGGWRPAGFTATSITSVSLDPLLVSFNINRTASSWPAVQRAEHLGAHFLHAGQHEVADIFATSGIDRFAAAREHWTIGAHGLPLLDDYLVRLVLQVQQQMDAGDSTLVIARVADLDHRVEAAEPLNYRAGGYA